MAGLFNPGAVLQQQVQGFTDSLFKAKESEREEQRLLQQQENADRAFALKEQQFAAEQEGREVIKLGQAVKFATPGADKARASREFAARVSGSDPEVMKAFEVNPLMASKKVENAVKNAEKCIKGGEENPRECQERLRAVLDQMTFELERAGSGFSGSDEETDAASIAKRQQILGPAQRFIEEQAAAREREVAVKQKRAEAKASTAGQIDAKRDAGVPLSGSGSSGTERERNDAIIEQGFQSLERGEAWSPSQTRAMNNALKFREQQFKDRDAITSITRPDGSSVQVIGADPKTAIGSAEAGRLRGKIRNHERTIDLVDTLAENTDNLSVAFVGFLKGKALNVAELICTNTGVGNLLRERLERLQELQDSGALSKAVNDGALSQENASLIRRVLAFDTKVDKAAVLQVLLAGSVAADLNPRGTISDRDFNNAKATFTEDFFTGTETQRLTKLSALRDQTVKDRDRLQADLDKTEGPPPVSQDRLGVVGGLIRSGQAQNPLVTPRVLRLLVPPDSAARSQWLDQFEPTQREIILLKLEGKL